jgi:hypothetical protein
MDEILKWIVFLHAAIRHGDIPVSEVHQAAAIRC